MRLVVPLMVAALTLTGCGGRGGGSLGGAGQAAGGSDINPQPRDQVRDGGTLRLPMDIFPNNFNYNQVDGTGSDNLKIDPAVLPSLFTGTADGELKPNPDYLTSVTLTSTAPQVVTYTLNPKATWSDGTPLSWHDFAAYWHSQNGSDPAYETSGTSGYSSISSVTRGVDDRQAVVTFSKPFAEWRNLFGPFAPASLSSTPQAFNTGWKTGMPVTAGPFTIGSIDPVAKTVTLRRDPKWWGTPAKLDQIVFKQYDPAALPDALANNELDYYEIASDINLLRRAQTTPGALVRDAPGQYRTQLTFNGAAGSPLAGLALRQAVAQGIDRAAITQRMLGPIEPNAHPDGNHIYSPGAKEYQDNAGVLPYDPGKAQQTLDSLGWVRQGNTRVKDGKLLSLRVVFGSAAPTNEDIFRTLQNQLGQIGVTLVAQPLSQPELFTNISRGNFDLALFSWGSTLSPISSTVDIYGQPLGDVTRENYGRVGTQEIDELFAKGIAELNDAKRADIGNQIDRLIWQQVHSVVLYARPGAVAERDNIANFGAFGLADTDYINAGFVK